MEETTEQRLKRFEKAYNILMDYFNYLPDDLKIKAHERLNKVNLWRTEENYGIRSIWWLVRNTK